MTQDGFCPCKPLWAAVSAFSGRSGIRVPLTTFPTLLGAFGESGKSSGKVVSSGILEAVVGSKRVQVKGGMLLLAAYPWKTPTGKAVREIWFEYFWKRRSKEWCWIFESGRILEEMRESL